MRGLIFLFVALFLVPFGRAFGCDINDGVQVAELGRAYSIKAQRWDFSSAPWVWSSQRLSQGERFRALRQRVRDRIEYEPYEILRRQRGIFERVARTYASRGDSAAAREYFDDVADFDLVLNREVGRIVEISCIESLLVQAHVMFTEQCSFECEFAALFLTRPTGEVRVYFVSNSHSAGVSTEYVMPAVRYDIQQGWELAVDLHLHPFQFSNFRADGPGADFAGTTIPSDVDLSKYRRYRDELGLREAWITNGFHTLRMQAGEFDRFVRR